MRKNGAQAGQKDEPLEYRDSRMTRFAPMYRERIAALTCCAPRAEDLIESFPGLLVALVSGYSTAKRRERAFNIILEGGSIKEAAKVLSLPMWLRKMPPEAFRKRLRHVPDEAHFAAKIPNFIPEKANRAGDWLEQVSIARAACDSTFALWVAKHCVSVAVSRRKRLFHYMACWAWHAGQPDTTGYQLIETPWSPKMGLRRATEELMRWRRRADLACLLGEGIESSWLEPGSAGAFEFVPLMTLEDFINESRVMDNCLDQYCDRLGTGLIRIFSIRRKGRPVADIELGPTAMAGEPPSIIQIKTAGNGHAPVEIWQAAQHWLEMQDLDKLPRRPGHVRGPDESARNAAFWQPYLDWLPLDRRDEFEQCLAAGRRRVSRSHLPHPVLRADSVTAHLAEAAV